MVSITRGCWLSRTNMIPMISSMLLRPLGVTVGRLRLVVDCVKCRVRGLSASSM